jgi:uncharacterized membrane protein YoaK (UPF0700 family)
MKVPSSASLRSIDWTPVGLALLCLAGGCVDAMGYLRYRVFAGAMTGNTVLLGLSAIGRSWREAAFHFAIILIFVGFVAAARRTRRAGWPRSALLLMAAALLAPYSLGGNEWIACSLAAAMGLQNGAASTFAGYPINTAFITGNVNRLGESLAELRDAGNRSRAGWLAWAWLTYAAGAALGAVASRWGNAAILAPVGLLCLGAAAQREDA